MAEAPSWLSPTEDVTPDHRSSALEVDSGNNQQPTLDRPAAATNEDEKDLPGIILTMRLANMGVAGALITCSVSREDEKEDGVEAVVPSKDNHIILTMRLFFPSTNRF
jgi:hypothetical protein